MNPKRPWLSLKSVIALAAGLAVIYLISILIELPFKLILILCLSSIAALLWMVIRLLGDQFSDDKTFDECFCQDREDMPRRKVVKLLAGRG
jgi:hypothetical protein